MKKLLFPFVILSLMFASCASKMERMANKQVEKVVRDLSVNSESVKILETKTKICNDSLCIVHVQFSCSNIYGARVTNRIEYILVRSKDFDFGKYRYLESTRDLREKKSIIIESKEEYKNEATLRKDLTEESYISLMCNLYCILNGRQINEE